MSIDTNQHKNTQLSTDEDFSDKHVYRYKPAQEYTTVSDEDISDKRFHGYREAPSTHNRSQTASDLLLLQGQNARLRLVGGQLVALVPLLQQSVALLHVPVNSRSDHNHNKRWSNLVQVCECSLLAVVRPWTMRFFSSPDCNALGAGGGGVGWFTPWAMFPHNSIFQHWGVPLFNREVLPGEYLYTIEYLYTLEYLYLIGKYSLKSICTQ